MRILFVGRRETGSGQRARALSRLGHDVHHIDPYSIAPERWLMSYLYRLGGPGIDPAVARLIERRTTGRSYDLSIVDLGDLVGRQALNALRSVAPIVVNYNNDNPYASPPGERRRWSIFERVAGDYDLLVTPRRPNAEDRVRRATGKTPMQVWFCADEIDHAPPTLSPDDQERLQCDIVFAGTWMPGRGAFMETLLVSGLRLRIFGGRWRRAPEYAALAPAIAGDHLGGRDYARAIAAAKIAVVVLNRDNLDQHTTRSAEIPAIGTAMVAPRTAHHLELYRDGREALFYDTAEECAHQCRRLLADAAMRTRIAAAGHARTRINGTYNEPLMDAIVARATGIAGKSEVRLRRVG